MTTERSEDLESETREILIAIKDDEHTERAVNFYLTQIKCPNDKVVCVHVIQPKPIHETDGVPLDSETALLGTMLRIPDEAVDNGKKICRESMQKLRAAGVKARSYLYVDGKPGVALCKACSEIKPNMILMGCRGCGQMKRAILGSVSTHVLHHSHIPVIVVPPKFKNSNKTRKTIS